MVKRVLLLFIVVFITSYWASAQTTPDGVGGWYMYMWSAKMKESRFGFQGDAQYRNWNVIGDLEQLLLRGGATYVPKATKAKFTLGYAFILSGGFGTDNKTTSTENRIYQEALLPHDASPRVLLTHRFRFEQRFVENQDYRMRLRYALFINIPLSKPVMEKGTVYLSLYDELFINMEKDIGNGQTVEFFDRNRLYGAIGYLVLENLKIQVGYMHQSSNAFGKGQLQFGVLQSF